MGRNRKNRRWGGEVRVVEETTGGGQKHYYAEKLVDTYAGSFWSRIDHKGTGILDAEAAAEDFYRASVVKCKVVIV